MNKQQIIETAQWVRDNCIVIDTETTGLGENDTIVELAAVCPIIRDAVISTLVRPRSPMSRAAEQVHGISPEFAHAWGVFPQHTINDLYDHMKAPVGSPNDKFMAAFNCEFDARLIMQTAYKANGHTNEAAERALFITREADGTTCIMELANRYLHEHLEWDSEQSKFKRLSLEKCLEITGIQREGEAHRALSDALAASDLLNFIAEGM